MSVLPTTLHALLGCTLQHPSLRDFTQNSEPESVKAYSDVVYYNYPSIGISLQFTPAASYKVPKSTPGLTSQRSDLDESKLSLTVIDIYVKSYRGFPILSSYIPPPDETESSKQEHNASHSTLDIKASTTGFDLVKNLGEPDRKGGGESRAVGVWLEWTDLGIMAEFTGIHGTGKWDKEHGAGASKVGVWSIFEPGKKAGTSEDD